VKRDTSITLRISQEELQDIKKAANRLWPDASSFSFSAKVRELLRQRVQEVLSQTGPK
jgi:predicted DNA binding CopG/RHH family protein